MLAFSFCIFWALLSLSHPSYKTRVAYNKEQLPHTHYWGFTCVIQATSETRRFWKNNSLDTTSLQKLWQRSYVSSFTDFFSVHLRERVFGWNQNFFSQIRWRPFLSNENQEESLREIIKTGKRMRDTLIIVLRHKKWRWWIWLHFYLRQSYKKS